MIRDAEEKDLEQLCALAERFIAESNLPYTFNYELAHDEFWVAIHDEGSIFLLDVQEDIVAGMVMGYMSRDFMIEYSAYMTKLYVEKHFRGIIKTKDLISAFEERVSEAVVIFASATGGIDERIEKLFVNMFKKSGYSVLGRIVSKNKL